MKRKLTIALLSLGLFAWAHAQEVGLKTNLPYLLTATPNVGVEFTVGIRSTLSISGSYNPFRLPVRERAAGQSYRPSLRHWSVKPEYKYWFCRSFERGYLGIQGLYAGFNVGGLSLLHSLREHRYEGHAYGVGISYGYQWAVGLRWGVEASVGAGYLRMAYDGYECPDCGKFTGRYVRDYFGPTEAAVSLVYFFR